MKTITKTDLITLKENKKRVKDLFKQIDNLVKIGEKITGDKGDFIFDYYWNNIPWYHTCKELGIKIKK